MKKTKMNKILIFGIAVIVLGGIGWYISNKNSTPEVTYMENPVRRGDISYTILATGNVEPKNRLEIKAPVAGRIDEILVIEGQDLKKGQIIAWMSSSERAAMLDAARAKGEAEFKKWSQLFLATPVLAPIDGKLIKKNVEPGQSFTTADAIFVMSDQLTVKAQVDETDIAKIKLKASAIVQLDAYPDNKLQAQVDKIAFDSTTVNNVTTYYVDVVPLEIPDFMRSGMTANVTFEIEKREKVLLIPSEALVTEDSKTLVRVKSPEHKSGKLVEVQLGLNDGKNSEVTEGLSDSDILMIPEFKIPENKNQSSNPFGPPSRPRGNRK